MTTLADALVSKVLGHSAAEKAFRPWWDNLEDFLIYGLVMLGLVVAPTAIINGTPLDCTPCQVGTCPTSKAANMTFDREPNFNAWWVKKYCTFTAVDGFILYFPYILLIMAIVIVLIERGFVRIFKAGLKLDAFYNLLVSESLLEGATTTSTSTETGAHPVTTFMDMEDSKLAIEVSHSFNQSSSYFFSYLIRTLAEFIMAMTLLVWLVIWGLPTVRSDEFIYCPVHGFLYECAGHPQQFYMYILLVAMFILLVYLFCCFYNLLWLAMPQLGSLSGVMRQFKKEFRKQKNADDLMTDQELLGDLYYVYYNNRDLKLLLDLLATSSGIAPCLRILCLFDKDLRRMAEVTDLKVLVSVHEETERVDVIVKFDDPTAMRDIFCKIPDVTCMYTVEILPAIKHGSVRAFKFEKKREKRSSPTKGDAEMQLLKLEPPMKAKFRGVDPCIEYSIRVCTVVNGKTISRRIEKIKPETEMD